MRTLNYHNGSTIIEVGASGDTAFIIKSGSAEVIVGEGKRAKQVAILQEGDVFGEMCLLEPGPRSATVRALADLECVVISYSEFINDLETNPSHAVPILKTLIARLRHMNQIVAELDPKKRSLLQVFKDWQAAENERWENMTSEEREIQIACMHMF